MGLGTDVGVQRAGLDGLTDYGDKGFRCDLGVGVGIFGDLVQDVCDEGGHDLALERVDLDLCVKEVIDLLVFLVHGQDRPEFVLL